MIRTKVVGVTHAGRQAVIATLLLGEWLWLVREPQNPHDRNAIRVDRDNGDQVGYLSGELAERIAPQLDRLNKRIAANVIELPGGTPKYPRRGVVLEFDLPDAADEGNDSDRIALFDDQLLPVLKKTPYLPRVAQGSHPELEVITFSWLPDYNVQVCLVYDCPETMRFATRTQLSNQGLTPEEGLKEAIKNLIKHPGTANYQMPFGDVACFFETIDGYDATRILLPSVRRRLCEALGVPEYVIGIPNRDLLVAIHGSAVEIFSEQIEKDCLSKPYPLTAQLFMANANGDLSPIDNIRLGSDWDLVERCAVEAEEEVAAEMIILASSGEKSVDEMSDLISSSLYHNPWNVNVHGMIGTLLDLAGDKDLAETCYKTALALDPDSAQWHFLLGRVYADQDRREDAQREFQIAYALTPEDVNVVYSLAVASGLLGQNETAVDLFKKAIALAPDHYPSHYSLGLTWLYMDAYTAAIREFKEAIRLRPDSAQAYYDLGVTLLRMKNYVTATHSFRRAIELDPSNAAAHYGLGCALLKQDSDDEEGICEWRIAARLGSFDAQNLLRVNNLE